MSDRTNRLLAVLVILMAMLVVAQTTVVPRNRLLSTIGIFFRKLGSRLRSNGTADDVLLFFLIRLVHKPTYRLIHCR